MKQNFLATITIFLILLKYSNTLKLVPNYEGELEFIILHNNDMHARFEQTSKDSGICLQTEAAAKECYGGFARTAHKIREFRQKAKDGGTPVLYLNAGDTYTGTPWFTIFKDNITSTFINLLAPDAISLGNHEFDEGVEGLIPFLNAVTFPVLCSNLDLKNTPELKQTKSLQNSTVFSVLGIKVGIIGYLTPETKRQARPNTVEYIDEIEAINLEAEKLKAQNITILIALGHSGYKKDKMIAKLCPEIDIVIGGHTNTFLFNGPQPDSEPIEGNYPTVITQASGKRVPVVQAFAYTKYLGRFQVKFDKRGNLLSWNGQPILLNATIPEDSDVLTVLDMYRPNITQLEKNIIGYTKVPLDGSICRNVECNMGNFIADSMIFARAEDIANKSTKYWTDTAIAIIQGGGIRSSISKRADASITMKDILTVLPFHNELVKVNITGASLRKALERSATLRGTDSNGGFLQFSGLHVIYDYTKKSNERVTSVEVLCAECDVPSYSPLDDNQSYNIILPGFILMGGDGFNFTESSDPLKHSEILSDLDYIALSKYIQKKSPIYPGLEWRISIISSSEKIRFSMFVLFSCATSYLLCF